MSSRAVTGLAPGGACWVLVLALGGCGPGPAPLDDLLAEAQAKSEAGDVAAAAGLLEEALRAHPESGAARAQLAALRFAAGEPQVAALEYRRALRDGAPAEQVSVPLALALLEAGKPKDALEALAEAPAEKDANAAARHGLVRARALEELRRPEAAAAFSTLLATDAGVEARAGLGRLAMTGGRLGKAREWLEQGLAMDDGSIPLLWLAGELTFEERDFRGSAQAYRRLRDARAQGGPLPPAIGLARAQVYAGDSTEAIALLETLLAAQPDNIDTQFYRALAAYRAGDYDDALRRGERILAQSPDYKPVYLLLGGARAALGDAGRAQTYLGHYLGSDPTHRNARRLLDSLSTATAASGVSSRGLLVKALFFSAN